MKPTKEIQKVQDAIKSVLESSEQLNEYVPNTHVAETLLEVMFLLEFEAKYPKCNKFPIKAKFAGYFNGTPYETYKQLRTKDDYYRNIFKLVQIHYEKEWNELRHEKKSFWAKTLTCINAKRRGHLQNLKFKRLSKI